MLSESNNYHDFKKKLIGTVAATPVRLLLKFSSFQIGPKSFSSPGFNFFLLGLSCGVSFNHLSDTSKIFGSRGYKILRYLKYLTSSNKLALYVVPMALCLRNLKVNSYDSLP